MRIFEIYDDKMKPYAIVTTDNENMTYEKLKEVLIQIYIKIYNYMNTYIDLFNILEKRYEKDNLKVYILGNYDNNIIPMEEIANEVKKRITVTDDDEKIISRLCNEYKVDYLDVVKLLKYKMKF